MAEQAKLEYDFNMHSTAIREYVKELTTTERTLVQRWLHKLANARLKDLEDCRLRAEFAYYLAKHCQVGKLNGMFVFAPPHESLKWIEKNLLDDATVLYAQAEYRSLEPPTGNERFDREPDKGGYLVASPIPCMGAYCHLAITRRNPKK